MKELTEKEALFRLTTLCSQAEHCTWEMTEKMRRWGLSDETQAHIMQYLTDEGYIDETRYCRAFVRDKIRHNKWGRRKVEQALLAKRISRDTYLPVLDETDDADYLEVLRPLLKSRRNQLGGMSDYEQRGRLVRFAMSRGFTFDIIRQCLDVDDLDVEEGEDDDD